MPTFRITAPDGRVFNVTGPEGSTAEEAMQQVQAQYQPQVPQEPVAAAPEVRPTRAQALQEGVQKQYSLSNNIGGAVSEPVTMAATGMLAMPIAGLAGIGQGIKNAVLGSDGVSAADRVERVQSALTYQPRTAYGKATTNALGSVLGYPLRKLEQGADVAGQFVSDISGSPAAGTAANVAIQSIPALLLRGKVGRGNRSPNPAGSTVARSEKPPPVADSSKAGRPAGLAAVREKPPAIEELRAAKNAAYKKAEETGVVVSRGALTRLKVELMNELKKEGIDKDLHPKSTAALKRITESKGQLTLSEIETLRKIANDAKGAIEKSDARIGAKIVDRIDDFENSLSEADVISGNPASATAYKEARALNARLSKAEEIQTLFDRAEISAPNFSGSGMENALRTEFRALAKNERKMRRFTPEERAAIKKVAMGGPMENLLRQVGKLAPTGIVSAGMGTMAGFAFGGPMGAAAVPAIGSASRFAATRMTKKNARIADELMRRGPENQLTTAKRKNALMTQEAQ